MATVGFKGLRLAYVYIFPEMAGTTTTIIINHFMAENSCTVSELQTFFDWQN